MADRMAVSYPKAQEENKKKLTGFGSQFFEASPEAKANIAEKRKAYLEKEWLPKAGAEGKELLDTINKIVGSN